MIRLLEKTKDPSLSILIRSTVVFSACLESVNEILKHQ